MNKKPLLFLSACLMTTAVFAQKIKTTEGDLNFFKDQQSVNVVFNYEGLAVGKFSRESDYIEKKKQDYNKKEAGKGDKWAEAWIADRQRAYEPQFLEQFEEKTGLKNDKTAPYTLIFHTTFIEPGFNVGAWRKNAYIDAEVTLVSSADPAKKLAVIQIEKSPGRDVMGVDFDTSWRISEAYAKAGKALARYLEKQK
ncbi:hypothetical protein GCM10027051_04420 [Niabella terrae]